MCKMRKILLGYGKRGSNDGDTVQEKAGMELEDNTLAFWDHPCRVPKK
jgi:hypothetical protein